MPGDRGGRSVGTVVFALVCLFFVGLGVHMIWHSTVTLPHTYDRLERIGAPATATVDKCAPGLGGGRGVACRLTLDYQGSARTWVYPENSRQFQYLPIGATVSMLVDPGHPRTAYTVTDVHARTNAGFGVVAGLGFFFICLGLSGIAFMAWLARRLRGLSA